MLDTRSYAEERIAGIDEVGRGSWAGPVVAAAAVLDTAGADALARAGVADSKSLGRAARAQCFEAIGEQQERGHLWLAVGAAGAPEIDRDNILRATMSAMSRAAAALPFTPDRALVDGNRLPHLECPGEAVVRGDSKILAIAAASIVAKTYRDRLMRELAKACPGYGWERNAGYGTAEHRRALESLGVTVHHRRSFAPIRELLAAAPTSC